MFVRTLDVHWKALRWSLAVLVIIAFIAPQLWAGSARAALSRWNVELAAHFWASGVLMDDANALFPLLAVATGVIVALAVWYRDHTGDHVLALSLPVSRRRYVLTKFAAGVVLLIPVAAAFLLGGVAALMAIDLPDWLHGRPFQFAFRFFLASLAIYSLLFAWAAGTIPTALKTLTVIAVVAVVVPLLPLLLDAAGSDLALRASEVVYHVLYEWPGPFAVLSGGWSLVGV